MRSAKTLVFVLLAALSLPVLAALAPRWWMCDQCAVTRKSDSEPWLQGCKGKSGGHHHFVFLGEDGPMEWYCSACGATVFLKQSTSPNGSTCPDTKATHTWRTR